MHLRPRLTHAMPLLVMLALFSISAPAATDYLDNTRLGERLQRLQQASPAIVHLQNLRGPGALTDLWMVELGTGAREQRGSRPALLLVAGIEGNDLIGTTSAVHWLEQLTSPTSDASIKTLLDSHTVYVFPRVNAEAAASFFAHPKQERTVSRKPTDDDRDGLVDEDAPEDLNADGLVTWMRIKGPEGDHILDPKDNRLLIKADRSKGEAGQWRYLPEGKDDDGDQAWNEDAAGGVNFNRNFPYNYSFFSPWAGPHQVSESPTRALADFVVDHSNIAIVFTFGAADNLVQTPKGEAPARKAPAEIHDQDVPFYRELGKAYRDALGLKKELHVIKEPGTFSDWMYFHRGRLSLAARPWSPELQLALAGASKTKATADNGEAKKEPETNAKSEGPPAAKTTSDSRGEEDRAFLKWLDENSPDSFVRWTEFDHPDFPDQTVEIGGYAPFARSNPPKKVLERLVPKHAEFLTELLRRLPGIGISRTNIKPLGKSVFEVTVVVENTGYLPTALAQGNVAGEVNPVRVVLDVPPEWLLAGSRITQFPAIEGSGGRREVRYLIHAREPRKLTVKAISVLGGSAEAELDLTATP